MQFKITVFYDSIALYDFFMIFEILSFMISGSRCYTTCLSCYTSWGVEAGPSFFFFHCPLFREGCGGSSSRLSRHTLQFSITSIISLCWSPKRFHPRSSMKLVDLVLGRPTNDNEFLYCRKKQPTG